ncbi:kinesin-like protein KIF21B variant [Aphelenchoides avenae]|nr:kinesin-like protein KIF21B variant [Aphelenchus avenae]
MVSADSTSVRVALRIRPQGPKERAQDAKICTSVLPGVPQVMIGDNRSFTYDHVFDMPTQQEDVYRTCVEDLVEGTFHGYNATVLAYGQTGSGKTHTMGTAFDYSTTSSKADLGIIPRAAEHIFDGIERRKAEAREACRLEPSFDVAVQFVELYNEEIIDLLAADRNPAQKIVIHEDPDTAEIYMKGVTSHIVRSAHDILEALKNGALNRTTAATNMNATSSRSHAIFTVSIRQQRMVYAEAGAAERNGSPDSGCIASTTSAASETELETLNAKFHFVDLAGSERLKRTGATGDRAKEGISINCGLLALGNVISALGGADGKVTHVKYRDSKLTRLLQDSLGGNSRTLMIACASPSDIDFVETLNTLNYANRAKNIKNKVVANQDKSSKMIGELRARIAQLEAELNEYKQGKRTVAEDGTDVINDQYQENIYLQSEVNRLRTRVKALQETTEILRTRNVELQEKMARAAMHGPADGESGTGEAAEDAIGTTIRHYLEEMENLRSQLIESQATSEDFRKQLARLKSLQGQLSFHASPFAAPIPATGANQALIQMAKDEIEEHKKKIAEAQRKQTPERLDGGDAASVEDEAAAAAAVPPTAPEDELEDEELHDDLDEEDSEAEDAENEERDRLCNDLADLQEEITIKEQLVMELENSERRLAQVRRDYERKLAELSDRITATEAERDRMLAEMAKKPASKASEEKARQIKDEYEKRLVDMRSDLRKMQSVEREHQRMRAQQERQREELQRYQNEIKAMKKNKVDLLKQLREENKRCKDIERLNAKKLAGLEKAARMKDNKIRQLEMRDRQREEFMRRKVEEQNVRTQKQAQKGPSGRPPLGPSSMVTPRRSAQRVPPSVRAIRNGQAPFSPAKAKRKWSTIQKKISRVITQRQTIAKMEEEMDRRVNERHALQEESRKLDQEFMKTAGEAERTLLLEEKQGVVDKLNYVQEQIDQLQKAIVDVDSTHKEVDSEDGTEMDGATSLEALVEQCDNLVEAKYLLQHLLSMSLDQGVAAAKAYSSEKEATARMRQMEMDSRVGEALMTQYIANDANLARDVDEVISARSKAATISPPSESLSARGSAPRESIKMRRRTATPKELLYPSLNTSHSLENLSVIEEAPDSAASYNGSDQSTLRNYTKSSSEPLDGTQDDLETTRTVCDGHRNIPPLAKTTSTTNLLLTASTSSNGSSTATSASGFSRDSTLRSTIAGTRLGSAKLRKYNSTGLLGERPTPSGLRALSKHQLRPGSADQRNGSGGEEVDERGLKGVFARLIPKSMNTTISDSGPEPAIVEWSDASGKCDIVSRTHTVTGHHKSVTCVHASETLLISGAKGEPERSRIHQVRTVSDRLAKVWDLDRLEEVANLSYHVNNVVAVRLLPEHMHLAMTASLYQVKLWDLRTNTCIQHFNGSGMVEDGGNEPVTRMNTIPFSETAINNIDVSPDGRWLFTTCKSDVRYWDMRTYRALGKLSGNNANTEVQCMALRQVDSGFQVFTGSRDHELRCFEMSLPANEHYNPKVVFQPPHYDGITSVVLHENSLFSASKDKNIMRFSLVDYKRDHVESGAHKKWIHDMCVIRPTGTDSSILTSACKEGFLKFWDITNGRRLPHVGTIPEAHSSSINGLAHNSQLLFTASSDETVGVWRIASKH